MTLKALNDLVGIDFIHEMSPFDIKESEGDKGRVERADFEGIHIRLESGGKYIAHVSNLTQINLDDEKWVMENFWEVIDIGILPK